MEKRIAKVLIVEDDRAVSELLRLRLTYAHYEVIAANNGREGWKKVQTEKPDLVILDVIIPIMNGIELCGLIKKNEEFKKIPVIMLTSKKTVGDWEKGFDAGANAYLNKPYDWNELIQNVERLLKE
jgi:DNA-binding response OmpR family regulator